MIKSVVRENIVTVHSDPIVERLLLIGQDVVCVVLVQTGGDVPDATISWPSNPNENWYEVAGEFIRFHAPKTFRMDFMIEEQLFQETLSLSKINKFNPLVLPEKIRKKYTINSDYPNIVQLYTDSEIFEIILASPVKMYQTPIQYSLNMEKAAMPHLASFVARHHEFYADAEIFSEAFYDKPNKHWKKPHGIFMPIPINGGP